MLALRPAAIIEKLVSGLLGLEVLVALKGILFFMLSLRSGGEA